MFETILVPRLFKPKFLLSILLPLVLVIAVSCGGDDDEAVAPAATLTPAPSPTATSVPAAGAPPTPTPTVAAGAPPTPTPTVAAGAPPTPTPTVAAGAPRELPTPTPPRPTPTPTPAPKVVGIRGGDASLLCPGYPSQWDPHLGSGLESNCAISPLYNQIVEFNPVKPGEIIGDLAKSWKSSEDGMSFTFVLHDNATWTDGQPITAEDAAFSVNRMIEPGEPRPRVGLLRPSTKDAEALGPHTLKVNLVFPSAAFLPFLAVDYMKVVPKHVIEAGIDINGHQNIVSGGPFMPDETRRGSFWRHERNPDYFKEDRPFFDSLTMNVIQDPGTIVAALKSGQVHWTSNATRLSVEDALAIEEDLRGEYSVHFTGGNNAVWVNVNTENEPWDDLRVIQAFRLATDQTELQKGIGGGRYLVGAPFPTNSWYGHTEEELAQLPGYGGMPGSTRTKQDDINDAIALLKEAGYDPPSTLGKREVQTAAVGWFPDLIQLWAQQMRRNLGVDMEVKLPDINTMINTMISGEFDMALWGYGVNIADPDDYVQAIYGGGARNYTNYVDPEIQELFDQQSVEPDPVKRQQILRQMETMLLEGQRDANILLEWATNFNVVSDRIRTEAGDYVPSQSIQTILKWEHMWFEE